MRYFSTFSGIGGFEIAIQRAIPNAECVGFSEIDKYAIQIYQSHFPTHVNYGDITKINERQLPDFELFVGGFPCQSFSIAGKGGGFADTRGTMFFEIARILKRKRPRLFVLENVKGLLSHDGGATFLTIITTLDELGYDLQWQVLNSKDFGVPQNRERVFIVGHLRGTPRPEVFPFVGTDSEDTRNVGEDLSYALDACYSKGTNTLAKGRRQLIHQLNNPTHSNDRVYGTDGISPTLNTMQGGNRQPFIALTEKRSEEAKAIRRENMKHGRDWSPRRGKELVPRDDEITGTLTANQGKEQFIVAVRGRYNEEGKTEQQMEPRHDGVSNTLTSVEKDNRLFDGSKIRRLTPMECERLQGFPDNWTSSVSDSQRYKTLGNAVTVNVVQAIASRLS